MTGSTKRKARPFIGIMFKCCKVYSRIYLNKKKTAFKGWCPKCARPVTINISPDGVDSSFFEIG